MEILEQVALAPLTTFGIGGAARWFVEARDEATVAEAVRWAEQQGLPLAVLGGGSNLLVRDGGVEGLVLKVALPGVEALGGSAFAVGAGESWDRFVESMTYVGAAGVECLAGVPGSVGGTPVQNVGAYGQEVSETIQQVRAYDRRSREFVELSNAQCRFRYRESLFNKDEPGRYIVTQVRFQLRADGVPTLRYPDLQRRFPPGATPTLQEVVSTVRAIRREKGMLLVEGDPDCRSAGSFFKNPLVGPAELEKVAAAVSLAANEVPHWSAEHGRVKLPAAWLLERAGFTKGYGTGAVGISSRHTLALVNRGGATFAEVEQLERAIIAGVETKFGIRLEREPVVMGRE